MTDPARFILPGSNLGIFDLCSRFNTVAEARLRRDPALQDQAVKKRGLIGFQMRMGNIDKALEQSPLAVFESEILAKTLIGVLPEKEVCDLVHSSFKHDEASKVFAQYGATALAKIFKP
jgi:hypothetical protein